MQRRTHDELTAAVRQAQDEQTGRRKLARVVPLALTRSQLEQVMQIAQPIPPDLREQYLLLISRALSGRAFGDGDVYRACVDAAKQIMWNVTREVG